MAGAWLPSLFSSTNHSFNTETENGSYMVPAYKMMLFRNKYKQKKPKITFWNRRRSCFQGQKYRRWVYFPLWKLYIPIALQRFPRHPITKPIQYAQNIEPKQFSQQSNQRTGTENNRWRRTYRAMEDMDSMSEWGRGR